MTRAPLVRVAIFWTVYLTILFVASIPKALAPPAWGSLVWGLLSSAAILAVTLLLLRREDRVARDVGLKFETASLAKLLAGLAIGFLVYGIVLLSIAATTAPIRFSRTPGPPVREVLLIVATYFSLSCMEELGFRGYPLRTLASTLGTWRAQALVAVAFGLSHLAFGWSWQTVVLGVLPNALLFGVAALAAGDLAMPVGLHAAVNIARWMAGETEAQGIWTMDIAAAAHSDVAALAPYVGAAATISCALALWWWHGRYSGATGRTTRDGRAAS